MQKILSYYSGWLSTLAWQSFVAVDSYICAALVQALIVLNDPTYVPQRWQTTLLMIAFVSGMAAFNVFFARHLAFIEGFFAVLHFVSWIAIVAVLWAMTPVKQEAKTVFTSFTGTSTNFIILSEPTCRRQRWRMELTRPRRLRWPGRRNVHRRRIGRLRSYGRRNP